MLQRGNVIIYDNSGKIWFDSGEHEGAILPNVYPDGLPYIETAFGELRGKKILSVDVEKNTLIFEDLPLLVDKDTYIASLEAIILDAGEVLPPVPKLES